MGLFDWIELKFVCPYCGKENYDTPLQTKDLDCNMNTYKKNDLVITLDNTIKAYTTCRYCKNSFWVYIKIKKSKINKIIGYNKIIN